MPALHLSSASQETQAVAASTSTYTISVARSASTIPLVAWTAFNRQPDQFNVMFPHALKELAVEREGRPPTPGNVWITIQSSDNGVDFVLSCTDGPVGQYPVFICTPRRLDHLSDAFIYERMCALADALLDILPNERVYSVFAPAPISAAFVAVWSSRTGILPVPETYYDSTLSFCTRKSLRCRSNSTGPGAKYSIRLACLGDIPKVAQLCFLFAATCEPFTMSQEHALHEATQLVRQRQLWVHTIQLEGQEEALASILAVTRSSPKVAAITKVYTNGDFRRRGCAERLTRHVCKHLLLKKERVVLYVGNDNPAAQVYAKVGFV